MHHEGREPVVRFELTALCEFSVGIELRNVRGDVTSYGLEQIAIFERELESWRCIVEDHESQKVIEQQQRRDHTQSAVVEKPRGQLDAIVDLRAFAILLDIDDPLLAREELRQPLLHRYRRKLTHRFQAQRPGNDGNEPRAAVLSQEQDARGTCENLRERSHGGTTQILVFGGRKRANESEPFDSIVVLRTEEILADENLCTAAQTTGADDHGQGSRREEQECHPDKIAEALEVSRYGERSDEIHANGCELADRENDVTRDEELQGQVRIAANRDREKRKCAQIDEPPHVDERWMQILDTA